MPRPLTPEHWSWTLVEAVEARTTRRRTRRAAAAAVAAAVAAQRQSGKEVFRAWL
jgi:hypothetical protein